MCTTIYTLPVGTCALLRVTLFGYCSVGITLDVVSGFYSDCALFVSHCFVGKHLQKQLWNLFVKFCVCLHLVLLTTTGLVSAISTFNPVGWKSSVLCLPILAHSSTGAMCSCDVEGRSIRGA